MSYLLIETGASFVENYIFYSLAGLILKKDAKWYSIVLLSFVTTILVLFLNSYSLFSVYTLILGPVVLALLATIVLKLQFQYTIALSMMYILCIHIFDCIIISAMGIFHGNANYAATISVLGNQRLLCIGIDKTLFVITYLYLRKMLKNKQDKLVGKKYTGFIAVGGWAGAFYLTWEMRKQINVDIAISWIFLLIIIVLVLIAVYYYFRQQHEKEEKEFADMRNELLEENYNNLKAVYEANAKLFHDFKHHIRVIDELINAGEIEEVKKYMASFDLQNQRKGNVLWTEDSVLNFILNNKITTAEEKKIEVSANIDYPAKANILSKDMTAIIANLFDNAIEACDKISQEQEKWICITIKKINNMLMIKLENSCYKRPEMKGKRFLSQKASRNLHGWGLKSVETTAQKYHGIVTCSYSQEEQLFRSVVNLCFHEIKE